jgi:hypothetical protein
MLMWSVPAVLISRRIAAARWKTLTAFLLGLNVIGIALLVPEVVVCLLRSKPAFNGLLGVELIWMLTCGGLGLARLAKTSTARAVLAFLFANLAMNVALAAAFVLGWLPLEVLKVLMYF